MKSRSIEMQSSNESLTEEGSPVEEEMLMQSAMHSHEHHDSEHPMHAWRLTATCEHGVDYKVSPEQLARGSLPPCTCRAESEAIGRRGSWSQERRTVRRFRRELRSL